MELVFLLDDVLETSDLLLREILPQDSKPYFKLCSDVEVMSTYGVKPHTDIAETEALILALRAKFENREAVRWGIFHKASEQLIGDIGYWRFVKERYRAEVGAKLAKDYWSKGLMEQALNAVVEYGFEVMGLHSVESHVDPSNAGALRLVEKLGFEKEGYVREHSFSPASGRFVDTVMYSAIKGRWKPRTKTVFKKRGVV